MLPVQFMAESPFLTNPSIDSRMEWLFYDAESWIYIFKIWLSTILNILGVNHKKN
jgi:hypothetical protein